MAEVAMEAANGAGPEPPADEHDVPEPPAEEVRITRLASETVPMITFPW